MNNPDHIFSGLETIFLLFWWLKYLNSLMRIRDPGSGIRDLGWRQFGSGIRDPGWKKVGSGIRDKHPGSATLVTCTLDDRGVTKGWDNAANACRRRDVGKEYTLGSGDENRE